MLRIMLWPVVYGQLKAYSILHGNNKWNSREWGIFFNLEGAVNM